MARIGEVNRESTDPEVRELLDWVTKVEGRVPNHFRLELHFPEHFKAWLTWVRVLWDEGELTFSEVQHIGIAVSKANDCPYCTGSFCSVLERGGRVHRREVEEYLESDVGTLGERERVLVGFALKANDDPHDVTQEDIERLRKIGLTERGIVQLVWIVNMYASSNRLNTVLGTDFEPGNPYQRRAEQLLRGERGDEPGRRHHHEVEG